jgi:hypothetical protein
MTKVECGNCKWTGDAGDVEPYRDFWSRAEVGSDIPAGDCPDCGAFCYLVDNPHRHVLIEVSGGLVQNVMINSVSISAEIHDYDVEGSDPAADDRFKDEEGRPYLRFYC